MLTLYSQMSLYLACIYYEQAERRLVAAIRVGDDWLAAERERTDLAREINRIQERSSQNENR